MGPRAADWPVGLTDVPDDLGWDVPVLARELDARTFSLYAGLGLAGVVRAAYVGAGGDALI